MQDINFLTRYVQELGIRGQLINLYLLQDIYSDCANFYMPIHRHIMQTKSGFDDSRVIDLPILKRNTIPNSTHFSDWMRNVASTLDEATYFVGFNKFSYMVIECDRH